MSFKRTLTTGCALFTMLFGAGNIIFPLILGRSLGTTITYAMVGFAFTGVLIPLLGFISVALVKGDYAKFLGGLGRFPGFIIATLCMALLGPLGAIPRCIAIAYADLTWYLPNLNMSIFSIVATLLIGICALRKNGVISLLGQVLGPIKVFCLLAIVALGLYLPGEAQQSTFSVENSFWKGLMSGYATMDLLAILFFSQLIYVEMNQGTQEENLREVIKNSLKVCAISGILMAAVYFGFGMIASLHGHRVTGVADDTLLSALASTLLGPKAGLFANITIVLTCLTTAIALTTTFSDFLSRFVLNHSVSYTKCLIITIVSSGIMANLRFSGIMSFIMPWISLSYPALTLYACVHLGATLLKKSVWYGRIAFFLALFITAAVSWK